VPAPKAFEPLPAPGDIVYCHFPQKKGKPGPKPRPALVIAIVQFDDGRHGVRVAYGTSQKVDELRSGEFSITPADRAAYQLSGLSFPTKFDTAQTQDLPYDEDWFRVPQAPRYGQTPKLGSLHASLYKRAKAAHDAALHTKTPRP
jgi:hypothetical protein